MTYTRASEVQRLRNRVRELEEALSPKTWIFNCVKVGLYSVTWDGRELRFIEADRTSTPVYAFSPESTAETPMTATEVLERRKSYKLETEAK